MATMGADASTDTPRSETYVQMGYWQNGNGPMNAIKDPNTVSGAFYMFQPLFESNSQKYVDYTSPDKLIGIIGESVEWATDGLSFTVTLRPEAKWSNGDPINGDDVVMTLKAFVEYRAKLTLDPQVDDITTNADKSTVTVTLTSEYANSKEVYETLLIGQCPIYPASVFNLDGTGGKLNIGTNAYNWFLDDTLTDAQKVSSGPYRPYAMVETGNVHVYKRVDSWWMTEVGEDTAAGITWSMPEPMYISSLHGADNFALNAAFANGEIDLFGGYIEGVGTLIAKTDTEFHTWTDDTENNKFYPLTSAMNEIAVNHKAGFPLNQVWYRKALATAINYEDVSNSAASGYIKQASPVWLDSDQPSMAAYYDATLATKWAITPGITQAKAILSAHAVERYGGWFSADGEVNVGDILALPNGENKTVTTADDELSDVAGINVKLGGYSIYCVNGWSDHMKSLQMIVNSWNKLGLPTDFATEEYGDFMTKRDNRDFQMYYSSLGNALANTPVNVMQYFTGDVETSPERNVTSWYSPDFLAALKDFSTSTVEADEKAAMSEMQDILGEVMPSIPVAVNCYWYTYNEGYWVGFPNVHETGATGRFATSADWIQPISHWTNNHFGLHQALACNLKSTGKTDETSSGTSPYDLSSVIVALVGVSLAAVSIRKYRK